MAGMKQLDLLPDPGSSSADQDDEQAPAWHYIELRGRAYRWRLWTDRLHDDWFDRRDPVHPKLWYQPPLGWAFDVEYYADCHGWARTKNMDTRWEIWQHAREERPWEG